MTAYIINLVDWPAWISASFTVIYTVITAIGTYYIVKTFREQANVNSEQRKINRQQVEINRLAMEKDRREIRPSFVALPKTKTDFDIILQNAFAVDIEILKSDEKVFAKFNHIEAVFECLPGEVLITLNFPSIITDDYRDNDSYTIRFKDEARREYFQHVVFNSSKGVRCTYPSLAR